MGFKIEDEILNYGINEKVDFISHGIIFRIIGTQHGFNRYTLDDNNQEKPETLVSYRNASPQEICIIDGRKITAVQTDLSK